MSKNANTVAMPKLIAFGQLDAEIQKFHKAGQSLQKKAHILALSVLAHLDKTKDIRVTLKFVESMPKMARVNGLRDWFNHFGPIAFNADGTAVFVKDKGAVSLEAANAKPFWEFKANEGDAYEPLDMDKFIDQTIAKLRKDANNSKGTVSHDALITLLAAQKRKPVLTDAGSAGSVDPLTL